MSAVNSLLVVFLLQSFHTILHCSSNDVQHVQIIQTLIEKVRVLEEKYAKLEDYCTKNSGHGSAIDITSGNKRLLLSNEGILQQQVAFSAYMSHPFEGQSFGKLRELVYDKLEINVGNAYNQYTGTFQAPVAGVYAFSWTVFVEGRADSTGQHGEITIDLVVNNVTSGIIHADTEADSDDDSATGFVIKSLVRGDAVYTRSTNQFTPQGYVQSGLWGRSTFSGWLIS